MKKLILMLLLLSPVCIWADNMSMVTYFPVPYVTYQNLNVQQDSNKGGMANLGIFGQQFNLAVDRNIEVKGNVDLGNSNIRLGQDMTIAVQKFYAGTQSGYTSKPTYMSFPHNVSVAGVNLCSSCTLTIKADQLSTVLKKLNMETTAKNKKIEFPASSCDDKYMHWTDLEMDGSRGLFLTCGNGVEPDCTQNPNQAKCCIAPGVSWNGSSCVKSCTGYQNAVYHPYYSGRYYPNTSMNYPSDIGGGTCDHPYQLIREIQSASGVSRECRDAGDDLDHIYSGSDYQDYLGTCDEEAEFVNGGGAGDSGFTCVYVNNIGGYSHPCFAGVMECNRNRVWSCKIKRFTSTNGNSYVDPCGLSGACN